MYKLEDFLVVVLGFLFFVSCSSTNVDMEEEIEEEAIEEKDSVDQDTIVVFSNHKITNGMTFSEINTVLKSASYGDTIAVEPGTYVITGELAIKNGITIHKESSVTPIFTAYDTSTTEMLEQYWSSNNRDIDIYGIQFRNIRINIRNASNTSFRYCIFDYGRRKAGTTKTYTQDAYIQMYNCDDMLVKGNVFKRRLGNSGRGIYTVDCVDTGIANNTFGNSGAEGYFVTAINDNSDGTSISGNTISRNESWVDFDETDHGIYVHSFNDVIIENNTISGWPAAGEGGAIKIRNGDGALIQNNTMTTSGILMYVYVSTAAHPYLKNIEIINNTISVANSPNDIYHGIGYWRNTTSSGFYEESILISGNNLSAGTLKITSPVDATLFNSNNGGVYNNSIGTIYLASGINNSNNY
ncbi:right-handed parallel beta-helix repeat-containing protein [Wenyingzhuangia sp. 2_MG-2023]|uniref:right-handed parallel beta-helix repeat-containing protein n=1 Tax=Wenyingzhuangia sp. 2_MG-2023 TaxID=3062639 RepID=UPI0026E35027|nr:right-handed parallel beta-helix repeat-containing protein [Wenyingzhuangia sp. 2_MG-2023]MDO6738710.1 right-handed parallel beta-helix repeat-containing protein [Wenyingzhuangia sp. 2_MG-2023]MDO6802302.1 right-handed parallel beta-helix repeat-containing protein [Wenyingzhuangia sp. 1_MG-2023]